MPPTGEPPQDDLKPGPSGRSEGDIVGPVPFCGPPTCFVYGPEQGPQQPTVVCGPYDPPAGLVTELPIVQDLTAGESVPDS